MLDLEPLDLPLPEGSRSGRRACLSPSGAGRLRARGGDFHPPPPASPRSGSGLAAFAPPEVDCAVQGTAQDGAAKALSREGRRDEAANRAAAGSRLGRQVVRLRRSARRLFVQGDADARFCIASRRRRVVGGEPARRSTTRLAASPTGPT